MGSFGISVVAPANPRAGGRSCSCERRRHDRRFEGHRRENIPVSGCSGRAWKSRLPNVTGLRITLEWLRPSTEASARGKDGADMHYRLEVTMASGCPWDIVLDPLFCCPPGELPGPSGALGVGHRASGSGEVLARAGTLPGGRRCRQGRFSSAPLGGSHSSRLLSRRPRFWLRWRLPAVWRTRRPSPPGSSALHAGQIHSRQVRGLTLRRLWVEALHRLGARPAHTTLLPARWLVLGRCSCPSRRTHSVRRRYVGFRHFQSRTSGMSWPWVSMYRWRWTSLSCTVCSR